jgi:hypothetical protein
MTDKIAARKMAQPSVHSHDHAQAGKQHEGAIEREHPGEDVEFAVRRSAPPRPMRR